MRGVTKRSICDLSVSLPYCCRWCAQSGKWSDFNKNLCAKKKQIYKKDAHIFSKKYVFGITKTSPLEWYISFVLTLPTPSTNRGYWLSSGWDRSFLKYSDPLYRYTVNESCCCSTVDWPTKVLWERIVWARFIPLLHHRSSHFALVWLQTMSRRITLW